MKNRLIPLFYLMAIISYSQCSTQKQTYSDKISQFLSSMKSSASSAIEKIDIKSYMTPGRAIALTSLVLNSTMESYEGLLPFGSMHNLMNAVALAVDTYQKSGIKEASGVLVQEALLNHFGLSISQIAPGSDSWISKIVSDTLSFMVAKDILKQSGNIISQKN